MQSGLVAERGTHDELIAANGAYKKLVSRQLVAYAGEQENIVKNDTEQSEHWYIIYEFDT